MSVSERKFGTLPTGEEVKIYHLENKKGAYAEVLQYGAILVKMCVPDKNGDLKDVVLGYDDIRGYEINGCFFGAIIGRSGNRIENSRFFIDDKEVVLAENENHNNLHSGPDGFEKKLWESKRNFPGEEQRGFLPHQSGWRERISGRIFHCCEI